MDMIGVADPDGTIRNPVVKAQSDGSFLEDAVLIVGVPLVLVLVGVGITLAVYGIGPLPNKQQTAFEVDDGPVLEGEALIVTNWSNDDSAHGRRLRSSTTCRTLGANHLTRSR